MKIKNCIIATMLFAFIVFANDTFTVKYVNSPSDGYLNLRAGAAANTALIMPVPHGAAVNVFNDGGQGNWARVSYQDRVGFMSRNFLSDTQQRGGANMPVISHVTDPRDNKTYRTTRIGNLTWMAENLKFAIRTESNIESWCYDNEPANCVRYGRLYTWDAALMVCPDGWRLPSDDDWTALVKAVGGEEVAGRRLKARTGWNNNGNGNDDFGFAALPGGNRGEGNFSNIGTHGSWWTSTEQSATLARYRYMFYRDEYVVTDWDHKTGGGGSSVRCVRD